MKRLLILILIFIPFLAPSVVSQGVPPFAYWRDTVGYPPVIPPPPSGNPVADSLVAYYGLEDLTDGHTGTYTLTGYNKTAWGDTAGVIGQASVFKNDSSQYAQILNTPQVSSMNETFTVMLWERPYALQGSGGINVYQGNVDLSSSATGWSIYHFGTGRRALLRNSDWRFVSQTSSDLSLRHTVLVFKRDVDSLLMYINGTLYGKIATTSAATLLYPNICVGAGKTAGMKFYGMIDEIYYWRGWAATPEFITWYYNSGAGRTYTEVSSYVP